MAKELMGIDINLLKEVKRVFKETGIEEMEMEETDSFYLKVSRKKTAPVVVQNGVAPVVATPSVAADAQIATTQPSVAAPTPAGNPYADESKYHKITSPVIGTFYAASSPEADPFIKVGSMVSSDTTVCIIEAMKVMNEIKAECKGKVVEILKVNADAVLSGEEIIIVETT